MAPYGRLGTVLARGTINATALVSLIAGGVFEKLPNLQIVVTTLAIGGIALAGGVAGHAVAQTLRRHVHVYTMEFNPALIRASVDILGADRVLAGNDWPIIDDGPVAPLLNAAFDRAGIADADRHLIAGGNARRLLGMASP